MTREEWLLEAKQHLEKHFFSKSTRRLPRVALSCGIPTGSARAIGQCWDPKVASDGTTHIFICPSIDKPYDVLHVMLHELCHAVVGVQYGHGKEFGRLARAVGLTGKLTSTTVPRESETGAVLTNLEQLLGDYPHKAINKLTNKKKRLSNRVTLVSPRDDRYQVSIKLDLLDEAGPPTDPWGELMEVKG